MFCSCPSLHYTFLYTKDHQAGITMLKFTLAITPCLKIGISEDFRIEFTIGIDEKSINGYTCFSKPVNNSSGLFSISHIPKSK